jgi:hypothetical protein
MSTASSSTRSTLSGTQVLQLDHAGFIDCVFVYRTTASFRTTLTPNDKRAELRGVFELLKENATVMKHFYGVPPFSSAAASITVSDEILILLQVLVQLDRILIEADTRSITVALVADHVVADELQSRKDRVDKDEDDTIRAVPSARNHPIFNEWARHRLSFTHITDWSELHDYSIASFYMPSLGLWRKIAAFDQLHDILTFMLRHHEEAKLFPLHSIEMERSFENKKWTYEQFHKVVRMPLSHWVDLPPVGQMKQPTLHIGQVETSILKWVAAGSSYMLKGAWSDRYTCVSKIEVSMNSDGVTAKCGALRDLLTQFIVNHHQRSFGIQRFCIGFESKEYRVFATKHMMNRWHVVTLVKTAWTSDGQLRAEPPAAADYVEVQRVRHAAEEILASQVFLTQANACEMVAIRMDFGIESTGAAFFSEFSTYPDAVTFNDIHRADVLSTAAVTIAHQIYDHLRCTENEIKQQEELGQLTANNTSMFKTQRSSSESATMQWSKYIGSPSLAAPKKLKFNSSAQMVSPGLTMTTQATIFSPPLRAHQ